MAEEKCYEDTGLMTMPSLRNHGRKHPGKAIRIVLNWLTLNAKDGYEIELHIPVPEEQIVYESRLQLKDNTINVRQV